MDIKLILTDYESLPEYSGLNLVDVNQVSLFGDRPINIAATRGSIEELETLVAHGANVNDAGEHGYTPLHNAVEQGRLEAVVWLLAHGADKALPNDAGETPAELALVLEDVRIASLLQQKAP